MTGLLRAYMRLAMQQAPVSRLYGIGTITLKPATHDREKLITNYSR